MKYLSLPTWILIRFFVNFIPKKHPWYKRKFSLEDWHKHSTDFTRYINAFFWVCFINITIYIYIKG